MNQVPMLAQLWAPIWCYRLRFTASWQKSEAPTLNRLKFSHTGRPSLPRLHGNERHVASPAPVEINP